MPIVNLRATQAEPSEAEASLSKITPRRDLGEKRSPLQWDAVLALQLGERDLDLLEETMPGSSVMVQDGAAHGKKEARTDTSPRGDVWMELLEPGADAPMIEVQATVRKLTLRVLGPVSVLSLLVRFHGEASAVAPLTALLGRPVRVRISSIQADLFAGGGTVAEDPQIGEVVVAREPESDVSVFGLVQRVEQDDEGSVLTIKDVTGRGVDVRLQHVSTRIRVAASEGSDIDGILRSYRARAKRLDVPASWSYLIPAMGEQLGGTGGANVEDGAVVLTPEAVDGALEAAGAGEG